MNYIYCIIGRSGSGKDTLVDNLLLKHPEWTKVISKTTRPKRSENESCHIFTTDEEYEKDLKEGIVVAHNVYNGYHYWATKEQVDNADFYIIDIPGLIELKDKYKGKKKIKSIGLYISSKTAKERMMHRGDNKDSVNNRLAIDNKAFKDLENVVDVCVNTEATHFQEISDTVEEFIGIIEAK